MRKFPAVGLIFIVILGIVLWILSGIIGFLGNIGRQFVLWLFPDNWVFSGVETIFWVVLVYFLDWVLHSKLVGRRLDWILYHLPFIKNIWKIIRDFQAMIENLKVLPRIEVEWPSPGIYTKGWLRQIKWAEVRNKENQVTSKFIECTCILPSTNNPTSGWSERVELDKIKYELTNSTMDLILHIISFAIYNPKWNYREFDYERYLEKEFIPGKKHSKR